MAETTKIPSQNPKDVLRGILNHLDRNDLQIAELKKNKQNKIDPTTDLTNKDLLLSMDKRFNKVDQRFNRVDKRFNKIDQKFDITNQKFDKENTKFDSINKRFDHMLYAQFGTILTIMIAGFTILAKLGTF